MANQTPVSKAQRNKLFNPYSKEVGIVAKDLQEPSSKPAVYVYHTEDKRLEVMNPMKVMVRDNTSKSVVKQYAIRYEYPIAKFFEEEDLELCSATSTFIKQARTAKPTSSILMVEVEGIMVSTIFIKPKKVGKGFA